MDKIEDIHHPNYAIENLKLNWESGECFHFILHKEKINQKAFDRFSKNIWRISWQMSVGGKTLLPQSFELKNNKANVLMFNLTHVNNPKSIGEYFFRLSKIDSDYWLVEIDWHHDWLEYGTFTQLLEIASIFALSFEFEFGFFSNNFGDKELNVKSLLNLVRENGCLTALVTFIGKGLLPEKEIKRISLAPLFQFRHLNNGYMTQVEPYSLIMYDYYNNVTKFLENFP